MNRELTIQLYQSINDNDLPRPVDHWQRFWGKVQVLDNGCWEWTANVRPNGYGKFMYSGKLDGAHRASYDIFVGDVPTGRKIVVDHLCHTNDPDCLGGNSCRHRRCVNPEHLQLISQQENSEVGRRGMLAILQYASRTHCKYGHELTPDNVYYGKNSFKRSCRECLRRNQREYKIRKKEALR